MAARKIPKVPDFVEEIVEALSSKDENQRCAALMEVERMGEVGARTLGYTQQVVAICHEDGRTPVQAAAIRALGAMGDAGHLPLIVKKLGSKEKDIRLAALHAIGSLGIHGTSAVDDLERCMTEPDADVVAEAIMCLGMCSATVASRALVAKLRDPHAVVRAASVAALCMLDREVDAIGQAFSDPDPSVRSAALKWCPDLSEASRFAPAAAKLLSDPDGRVRSEAADFLIAQGKVTTVDAGTVGKFLGSPVAGVRAAAAVALAGCGHEAASQIPALESMLTEKSEDTSSLAFAVAGVSTKAPAHMRKPACAAAFALRCLGERAGPSAAKVAAQLKSDEWEVRAACLECLAAMGSYGAKYEKEVCKKLEDPFPLVVAKACEALGLMHEAVGRISDAAAAGMTDLLHDKIAPIRAAAAEAVGRIPAQAIGEIDTLVKMLSDRVWTVRRAAVIAISKCGPLGEMYAAELCRMIEDANNQVRIAAIEALGGMGERGVAFIEDIEAVTQDPIPEVAEAAAAALEKLSALTKAAAAAAAAAAEAAAAEKAANAKVPALPTPMMEVAAVPSGPLLPVALLFPGQGSQYVKMLAEVQNLPEVKAMLSKAKKILGYDLLDLCLNGPETTLEQTKYCQPALYVGGLAAVELLRRDKPEAVECCRAVAGLSLGEYTALTAAGVFDFETGLRIVKLRGEAMQTAAEASEQAMLSVAGLEQSVVEKICEEIRQGDICQIANFLFPKGFAIAGSKACIARLKPQVEKAGCLQAKQVKTSGAFHTDFMKPAGEKLSAALRDALGRMRPPRCDVYMNVTGAKLERGTDPAIIVELLSKQLTNCVLWEPSVKAMIGDEITEFYECGPMKQLKAMMKRIDQSVWKATTNVHV